jgi:hypothetical protein
MNNISRPRFVRILAGIPFIGVAAGSGSGTVERTRFAVIKSSSGACSS